MKTAVVILNWNGIQYLKEFLPTLVEFSPHADVVVIDNASNDDSVAFLKECFPTVRIIENAENGGFAKGYNEGLAQLEGEYTYYAIINSDIEVTPGWLQPLEAMLTSDERIAGVQPKVLAYHQQSHFEYAGASGGFIDKNFYPFCRGRMFNVVEEDQGQYDNAKEVFWTTGACMLVRAKVFHALGGFDPAFFAHMEEIDFCWRAKRHNYAFYVEPKACVYHVGGGTLAYDSPQKTFLNFRNSLYMIHKNYEGWLFGKIFYRLILDGLAGVQLFFNLKFAHVASIVKAHFAYYGHLPELRKQRKSLQKSSTEFNRVGLYKASILWAYFFKKIRRFEDLNKRFFNE